MLAKVLGVLIDAPTGAQFGQLIIMLVVAVNVHCLQFLFVLVQVKKHFSDSGGGPSLAESLGLELFQIVVHSDHSQSVDHKRVLLHLFGNGKEVLQRANGMTGEAAVSLLI